MDYTSDRTSAFGALANRIIAHFLKQLKYMTATVAFVFIGRHNIQPLSFKETARNIRFDVDYSCAVEHVDSVNMKYISLDRQQF